MSGLASRNKGKRGELEVANLISDLTGWDVRRRVRQHDGDTDLEGVPGWSCEVKNCATLSIGPWWAQAVAQADPNRMPVLFYKIPRKGWRAMWPLSSVLGAVDTWQDASYAADTTIEAWCSVARELAAYESVRT